MLASTSSARPPSQYVVTQNTQFRLAANEYDKNTYAQCNYESYRTLIRCRQIRSKEALAKNKGMCEEHTDFSQILNKNHKKEVQRCHAENDSKMQRRRFDPWIVSNEYISDEDDFLQPVSSLPIEFPEMVSDNVLDDHPLRHAGTYTDKDLLHIKMDLVQKDIDDLTKFKQLLSYQAKKEYFAMKNDEEFDGPTDMPQRRAHNASKKYARADYLTLTTIDPVFKPCCVGPDMDDHLIIGHLVQEMLDKLDNFTPTPIDKPCDKPALHLSNFCIDHVTLDRRQKLFEICRECGLTTIGGVSASCGFHIRHRAHASTCRCQRCVQPEPRSSRDELIKCDISSDDEEDTRLANLSRIESMVSPMTQFAPATLLQRPPPQPRRYQGPPAQLLRPPQMGPPMASSSYSSKTAAQRVVANMRDYPQTVSQQARQRFDAEQQALKMQEEEAKTMTCARVRAADLSQYGSGKKKQQAKATPPGQNPSSYFSQKKVMPSIISPGITTSPIRNNVPFSGWRNTPTPRSMHQQHQMPTTRFPVQNQRHPPRTIPLERIQEPKNADELVEDCGSSPNPGSSAPEPPRRGVPYYRNMSAYRRTETPTRPSHPQQMPSTSGSSGLQYPPPPPPPNPNPPPRFRQPARPVAPHRAIAAGLNPADIVNPATPRPSFRMPLPHQNAPIPGLAQLTPAHAQYRTHPRGHPRLAAGGAPIGGSPSKITTSYTVVGSGARPSTSSTGSTPSSSSISSRQPQRFANSAALDSARNDARFANMNVKTYLTMGNKDPSKMTQEEIDQLVASSLDPQNKRKNPGSAIQSPTMSPRREGAPPEPQSFQAPETAPTASEDLTPSKAASASRASKKRKIDETIDAVASATESIGEPTIKKVSRRESVEKDRPKTPKAKKSSPAPSGSASRTPRAAAIAANQAIVHHKPSSSSAGSAASSQDVSDAKAENPLDLLAELSEAAAAEEHMDKTNKKTPKKQFEQSSSSAKKRDGSEEL